MSFNQQKEIAFFMEVPRLDDLCSVVIMVPPLHSSDSCPYQPHIIRCRELIFTEPDIIATPLLSMDRHIQIILQQSYYKTGRLQARFKKMGFEMKKPHRVIPGEMQACLNYTIMARLAPLWNRLGDLLTQGRDFLLTKDRMNAINFELNVTEEQTYLVIKARSIRSLPFKHSSLGFPPGFTPLLSVVRHQNTLVSSCPSRAPESSSQLSPNVPLPPLKSYRDSAFCVRGLKLWNELPAEIRNILCPKKLFLNPSIYGCFFYELTDVDVSAPLIQEFVNNYPHGRIEEHSINRKWCHILPSMKKGQIISIHQVIPSDSPFKSYKDMKRYWKNTYGYRLPESEEGMLFVQVYFKLIGEKLFTYPDWCIRACPVTYLPRADANMIAQGFLQDLVTKVPSLCGVKLRITSGTQYMEPVLTNVTNMTPQCVPNLTSTTEPFHHRSYSTCGGLSGEMTVVEGNIVTVPDSLRLNHNIQPPLKSQQHGSDNRIRLRDAGNSLNQEQVVPQICQTSQDTDAERIVPAFKKVKPHSSLSGKTVASTPSTGLTFTGKGNIRIIRTAPCWPAATQSTELETSSPHAARVSPCLQAVPNTPVLTDYNLGSATLENSKKLTVNRSGQSVKLDNWQRREVIEHTPAKKPRTKPKIQAVDVELLAKNNQLAKVNNITLINWLQKKGIPCRSKDKKSDLILKVQSLVK